MGPKIAVRFVDGFLYLVAAVVISVGVGIVEARAQGGWPPFPWTASSWSFSRQYAENGATNKAIAECNDWDLVLDTGQMSWSYGTVNYSCPPLSYCHTATLSYYCEVPPPRYAKRTISPVDGTYECNPATALATAEAAAEQACAAQDPNRDWFLGDSEIIGVSRIATGSCDGVDDGWDVPEKTKYRLLPECWMQY